MTYEEKYNYLTENGIATDDEIDLVVRINGMTQESLDDILWVRTGYHTWECYDYYEGICKLPEHREYRDFDEDEADSYLNEYTPEELLEMLL